MKAKYLLLVMCLLLVTFFLSNEKLISEQTFYNLDSIQTVEITFDQPDWDYRLDTAKLGSESLLMARTVKINGTILDSVGVKYKGNSSFDTTYKKNPFNISLDEFKSQSYQGIKTIKLANCYQDPSMIREVLSYNIAKDYMDCPRANYAKVYINDAYIGLYANTETINKQFCSDHFYSSNNTFIDCTPVIKPGPNVKSNLKYIAGADSTAYFNYYEIKSKSGWNDLVNLCDTVTNYPAEVPKIIDMDRLIWMLAWDQVMLNIDSYIGVFCQNYYLYRDKNGYYNPILWDLNMSFGGFPFAGSSNNGMGSLTLEQLPSLPVNVHANDPYWPLLNIVLNNDSFKKMFIAHAKTICEDWFLNDNYLTLANELQGLIDEDVKNDGNKFFSYEKFLTGLTDITNVGSYSVPGIRNLMADRMDYLYSTPEFKAEAPFIATVAADNAKPHLNSAVTINATVTGVSAEKVFIGIRFDKKDKFVKAQMFDDGKHGDGEAGDNVYGASFTMNAMEAQYYIYAENDAAAAFSPARAEHEFYTIEASAPVAKSGEIVINEFLAKNSTGKTNESGTYEDWIELYNKTDKDLSLAGLYLSDDYSNPSKFVFPESGTIKAKSWLAIWADEGNTTESYIHCNFKLSASGEQLMLSNSDAEVLDSISFGAQSADKSLGRCPDGSGNFIEMSNPTFADVNDCTVGVEDLPGIDTDNVIFPNPAVEFIILPQAIINLNEVYIYSNLGIILYRGIPGEKLDVRFLEPGLYFLRAGDRLFKFLKI